jgi:hypothetical protein
MVMTLIILGASGLVLIVLVVGLALKRTGADLPEGASAPNAPGRTDNR